MGKVDKPRWPKPAFCYFLQECQQQHLQEHPNVRIDHDEFVKKCSQRWTQMSREERDPYHQMFKKDKKRYHRELATYVRSKYGNEFKEKIDKLKKLIKKSKNSLKKSPRKKDSLAPKRYLSAFLHYVNDQRIIIRVENPGIKHLEMLKKIKRSWKACSEDQKAKYKELASKDRERYKKQMEAFKAGRFRRDEEIETNEGEEDSTSEDREGRLIQSSRDNVESNIVEIKKPRRNKSAYNYFMQEFRQQIRQQNKHDSYEPGEWLRKCSQRWNRMRHEEKNRFHQMAKEDRKRYFREMVAYLRSNHLKTEEKSQESEKKIPKQSSSKKDPFAPKRKLSDVRDGDENKIDEYADSDEDSVQFIGWLQSDGNYVTEEYVADQDDEGVRDGDAESQRNQNEDDDNDVIDVSDS